jgi:hypothetical protein
MKIEFSQEIKNVKPFVYYEVVMNDGDSYEEYELGICFDKEENAISYLKKKADIIFENSEDFDKFDFSKINMDKINIYIENDGYSGERLYINIKTKELACEEDKECVLFNNKTWFIRKQSKFFIENKENK